LNLFDPSLESKIRFVNVFRSLGFGSYLNEKKKKFLFYLYNAFIHSFNVKLICCSIGRIYFFNIKNIK